MSSSSANSDRFRKDIVSVLNSAGRGYRSPAGLTGSTYGSGRKYVRVMDYKTGSTKFDYGDVENGLGTQLLLYCLRLPPRTSCTRRDTVSRRCQTVEGRLRENQGENSRGCKNSVKGRVLEDLDVILSMEDIGWRKRVYPGYCERKRITAISQGETVCDKRGAL